MSKDIVPTIQKQISPIVSQAQQLKITSPEEMTEASTLLTQLNKNNDRVTKEKESITKPLNEALRVERGRWKPIELQLEEAIKITRQKMSEYQTKESENAKRDADKIALRVGEGRGKLKPETAAKKIEALAPDKNVTVAGGSVQFVTVKHFEIVNFNLVPDEYKLADETKIRHQMRAGIEVSGVRYYETQEPRNSR